MYSYSKFKTFEACPHKFYLKYVKRAPLNDLEAIEIFTGRTVHKVIEIHSKNEIRNTQDALYFKLDEIWQNNWHPNITPQELEEKYKNHARKCLENYYEIYKDKTNNSQSQIEYKLFGKIANETLTGIIDRLETGEKYTIIDYKTGEMPTIENYFTTDWQLALYALLITQNTHLNPNNIQLQWEYIAFPKTITLTKTQAELEQLASEIENKINTIKNAIKTNNYEKNTSDKCNKCEYYQISCDGKKEQREQEITLNTWMQ